MVISSHPRQPSPDRPSEPASEGLRSGSHVARDAAGGRADIRLRIAVILAILIPSCSLFLVWGNWTATATGDVNSLSHISVAGLSLLLLLNAGARRFAPRWAASRGELIAAFSVLAVCAGIMGNLWMWGSSIAQVAAYPPYAAQYSDRYSNLMLPYLPTWLMPMDRRALSGFFLGESSPYSLSIIATWLRPALWWTAWVSVTLWVALCLGVLVRRRWAEEERLAFPIATVPLQMTDPEGGLYRSRLFWVGVWLATAIVAVNTLNRLYPALPAIPTRLDLSSSIANNPPWDGLRCPYLDWSLGFFGLAYLIPLDLAFSLIVFNLWWRTVYVASRAQGWLMNPWGVGFPYGDQQAFGSYLAIVALVLWLDRRHILQIIRKSAGLSSTSNDSAEAFGYRTAIAGLLLGVGFLMWFYLRCGMSLGIAGVVLVLFFTMLVVMMRLRAQLGAPSHWMYGTMPQFALMQYPGLGALGPRALGILAMLRPFMGEQNGNPAPTELEALYMSNRAGVGPRRMAWVIAVSIPVIMLSYFWASLHTGYRLGMEARANIEVMQFCSSSTYGYLEGWLRSPSGYNYSAVSAMGIGAIVTVALICLKLWFPFWPLHPIAFPLASQLQH